MPKFTYYVIQKFDNVELCVAGFNILLDARAFVDSLSPRQNPFYIIAVEDSSY